MISAIHLYDFYHQMIPRQKFFWSNKSVKRIELKMISVSSRIAQRIDFLLKNLEKIHRIKKNYSKVQKCIF